MNLLFSVRYHFLCLLTATLFFTFQPILIAGGLPESVAITGVNWAWQQTRYDNGQMAVPSDPSRYTVTFNTNGTLNIQADCNWGGGRYTIDESTISIVISHTTRAKCPPDSLEQTFIKDLNASELFFFKDQKLYLNLKESIGTITLGE